MIIAGVVIETAPGWAAAVAERLQTCEGLEIRGNDQNRRLAGVWKAASGAELERAARDLVRSHEDILGVYPTLVERTQRQTHVSDHAERCTHEASHQRQLLVTFLESLVADWAYWMVTTPPSSAPSP